MTLQIQMNSRVFQVFQGCFRWTFRGVSSGYGMFQVGFRCVARGFRGIQSVSDGLLGTFQGVSGRFKELQGF